MSENMAFGLAALGVSSCTLLLCYRWWLRWLEKQIPEASPATQASKLAIDQLEQSIGGSLANIIKHAYLDGSVARVQLPKIFQWRGSEYCVNQLIQADAQANRQLVRWHQISQTAFIFAMDDFGNYYFVKANDNAIYFWDYDLCGDTTKIFESADDFWKQLQPRPSIS